MSRADEQAPAVEPAPAEAIRDRVARLSRPAPGGRRVIERAAIVAEGTGAAVIFDWLAAASWEPEDVPASSSGSAGSGLHGMRRESGRGNPPRAPRRYVSPPSDPA